MRRLHETEIVFVIPILEGSYDEIDIEWSRVIIKVLLSQDL